ncbi:Uma2 family endonuclease [Streptomyces qinzhouensis]|uniref:Uma2 family endonuclease n=1 Tax=Streptomyces qinzhouensis TaxID=2599401 RepID=A0A5B8JH98_9ACTN|nr:Uma2 family endonuclease [Streptomyces qinzhouensis]QDY77170.1 Uma2 family endonuclease [Streptomyces qinzhouensis]
MTAEPVQHWPVPPLDGYTVDDLLTLPDLPPHTELMDGSLVFVSPQRDFHSVVIDLLVSGLRQTVPGHLRVRREMTVVLDRRNAPEPDVLVVSAEAVTGPDTTSFAAADVLLAVEVVSPDSRARDTETKPRKYAAAGIQNFWLVDRTRNGSRPVVRAYELDPVTKAYVLAGVYHDRLKLDSPFGLDLDLAAADDF